MFQSTLAGPAWHPLLRLGLYHVPAMAHHKS